MTKLTKKIIQLVYFKAKKSYLKSISSETPFEGKFDKICEKYGHSIKFVYGLHPSQKMGVCSRCHKTLCSMQTDYSYTIPEITDTTHPLERINKLRSN